MPHQPPPPNHVRRVSVNKRPSLVKQVEVLSYLLNVPMGDRGLLPAAVAILEVARALYQVIAAGHGSVKIYIEDGWVKGTAMELTSLPDPDNRRPDVW